MASSRRRWQERREYDPLDPAKQHEVKSAASVVSSLLDSKIGAGTSEVGRALSVWRRVCGKRAAKHTVAVWLNKPEDGKSLPELIVYLDGNTLMVDLTTDAEMYQERLAFEGLEVSKVSFKLSRKAGEKRETSQEKKPEREVLPTLSAYEEARVDEAVATLDPRIKENASEAMKNSIRRAKLNTTSEAKTDPQNPR
jgi:hypothetical protein